MATLKIYFLNKNRIYSPYDILGTVLSTKRDGHLCPQITNKLVSTIYWTKCETESWIEYYGNIYF